MVLPNMSKTSHFCPKPQGILEVKFIFLVIFEELHVAKTVPWAKG
jgi:hypothetical protein